MSEIKRKVISLILSLTLCLACVVCSTGVSVSAADFDSLNDDNVFVKQQTGNTCTLASAVMMLRRTAICSGYEDWEDITEGNVRSIAWIDGVGLRWSFSCYNMTVGHGYFSGSDNKLDMIDLLEKYPQGVVVYNGGNDGQNHAVFLCDYDEEEDIFYVADPTSTALVGRIALEDSTIVGESQSEQIDNFTAYWYISDPAVVYSDGEYSVTEGDDTADDYVNNLYDPSDDTESYESSMLDVNAYYVVTDNSSSGAALRSYPSGNSDCQTYAKQGDILYITSQGTNKFGALWYMTSDGYYIFSSNVTAYEKYSAEIQKFNATSDSDEGTYVVHKDNTALCIEPVEGNNVIAYLDSGSLIYVVESGVNSIGAKWYKTSDGYYIKASAVEFEYIGDISDVNIDDILISLSGSYSVDPVYDDSLSESYYEITASSLNIRTAPVDGTIITSIPKGTYVKVLEIKDNWGKITYNDEEGWISLKYAVRVDEDDAAIDVSSITLSQTSVSVGEDVICTLDSLSNADYNYKYSVCNVSGELIYSDTEAVSTPSFTYTVDTIGEYYFAVEVSDSLGTSLTLYSANFVVRDKIQLDSVTSDADDFVYAYDTIVWSVNASSVSDNAVYNYFVYRDGELIAEQQSDSSDFSYTPQSGGAYVLEVYVSDDGFLSDSVFSQKVDVYTALNIDAINLSATSVALNSEVACSVSVSGGTGGYSYCFSVFKDDVLIKNGSFLDENETVQSFEQGGSYKFFCTVTDSAGIIVSSFSAEILVFDCVKGDVNFDGAITASDARLVLRLSAGLEPLDDTLKVAADVNSDGFVNAFDARCVLRYSAKMESSFS